MGKESLFSQNAGIPDNFHAYLQTIISKKDAADLVSAIESIKNGGDIQLIVVGGPKRPTGKSTLVDMLRLMGVNAVEEYQIHRVELTRDLCSIDD